MQLLNEIDRRLNAAAAAAEEQPPPGSNAAALPSSSSNSSSSSSSSRQVGLLVAPADSEGSEAGLFGEELVAALQELRGYIQEQWLESLPQPK
jgi:hypothetical protein